IVGPGELLEPGDINVGGCICDHTLLIVNINKISIINVFDKKYFILMSPLNVLIYLINTFNYKI
ncbi:MAG: hypothetical protein NUV92_08420, partial [Ignavibacteria bacterium]|nr:hypothetical protein [Ignavibacteria bacterium]